MGRPGALTRLMRLFGDTPPAPSWRARRGEHKAPAIMEALGERPCLAEVCLGAARHLLNLSQEGAHAIVGDLWIDKTQGTRYSHRYSPEQRHRLPQCGPVVLNARPHGGVHQLRPHVRG